MKRALVLSGGGSRGAYQIGVWKALRKMNIKIDIVTGTSIGALNGALIVQNDYYKGLKLWNNLDFSMVFDTNINTSSEASVYKEYVKEFFEHGGMEIKALERTIKEAIDEEKLYDSKIDFGLTTVKLNTLTPIMLTKREVEPEKMADYLIASAACYPAFKQKEIDGDSYIDGGYYDNLPINLAIKMGATHIIAVDLRTIGFSKKIKDFKNIDYIKPNHKLGNFLIFDENQARQQINLGYNDTLKHYNKAKGSNYTFKKINYILYENLYLSKFQNNLLKYIEPKTKIGKVLKTTIYNEILLYTEEEQKQNLLESIEKLMEIFSLKEDKIYTIKNVKKEIKRQIKTMPELNIKQIEKNLKKQNLNNKLLLKHLIIYINYLQKQKDLKKLTFILFAFPKEYMAATYFLTISNNSL